MWSLGSLLWCIHFFFVGYPSDCKNSLETCRLRNLHPSIYKAVMFFFWDSFKFQACYGLFLLFYFLGSFRHSSYHPQNPGSSLHPPPQDLGQIYGFGRSPVLPRKRNGLFTNPIRSQHWTYEGTIPSAGGGAYQPTVTRYMTLKETSTAPQSILIKPDTHRHNTEKVSFFFF